MSILNTLWRSSLSDVYTYVRAHNVFGSFEKNLEVVDLSVAGQRVRIQTLKSSPEYQSIATGAYESFLVDFIKEVKFKNQHPVIWDLGAHVGYISLILASMLKNKGTIIAFEPNLNNVNNFKANVALNPELTNIILEHSAVGGTVGELTFTLSRSKNNPTTMGGFISSALPPLERQTYEKLGFYETKVPCTTIDEYTKKHPDRHPEILKIDVEGAELEVLLGGANYLKTQKPLLIIEVHHIVLLYKTLNILKDIGYRVELLNEDSASPSVCTIIAQ